MVIGAYLQDGARRSSGAAYVYERRDGRWTVQAKLKAADGQRFDWFGSSAAISGDTLVVGAQQHFTASSEGGGVRGKVYVFTRQHGRWTQAATLLQPEGEAQSEFGTSVSISGPVILVGADLATSGGQPAAGAAYVYRLQQGSWILESRLQAAVPQNSGRFGSSTALDGETALLGGLHTQDAQGSFTGAAWVFEHQGSTWRPAATLFPPDGADGDNFGNRVAFGGRTAVVGALDHLDPQGRRAGATYVWQRDGSGWRYAFELQATDGQDLGKFSCSLGTDGRTLLVGAGHMAGRAGPDVGEAYVHKLPGN